MLALLGAGTARAQTSATLAIQADQPGAEISSNLFGIFFEEINSAGDGGIYAELVRNRNFEEPSHTGFWQFSSTGTASGSLTADTSVPLSASNRYAARLTYSSGSGSVSAANNGWWGMNFQAGQLYDLNFHARCSAGFTGAVFVRLQNASGSTPYAQATVTNLSTNWQSFSLSLSPGASDPAGRLGLFLTQTGSVWLDVVSLFPRQTFKDRANGLRLDLANMLVDLQPGFVRFPGGSWVNGDSLTNMYNWKRTIGPIGDRWVQHNLWGYEVNNGLGYHEYLQMAEDLGAEPLFVINCGMIAFYIGSDAIPLAQMGPYVQDALDAIEYANGPTNSTWGALRAAAGHPQPFNLKYIEIGNENGGTAYNDRYALFYDAIKSHYPGMRIIANNWGGLPTSRPVEISDEHYYYDATFFMANANRYDGYSRSGPKIYVGEYAVTTGAGNGNLNAALGEAAFMTGMERNSDIVTLSCYAPLFANLNNKNWNPDLIYFNSSQVYGTPSYYAQKLFARNRGDAVLPLALSFLGLTNDLPHGAIGLGTWITQASFTNVVVTQGAQTWYQSDFTSGAPGWTVYAGSWNTTGGRYRQTSSAIDCRSTTGDTNWSDITINLKARKDGGNEGFLILFNWLNDTHWTWWNIGGWGNSQHAIEQMINGTKSILGQTAAGSITTGVWYDIRIVLSGSRIRCYLDNVLIHDVYYPTVLPLYASASYHNASGQIIVKAVNGSGAAIPTTISLGGLASVAPQAGLRVLTSASAADENSLAQPTKVSPVTSTISNAGTNFACNFPANSLTILRLQTPPTLPILVNLNTSTNVNDLAALPGGVPVGLSSFITNSVQVNYSIEAADGTVATNGTLQIDPGSLAGSIPVPAAFMQPGAFFRLTLSGVVNGQLGSATRAYFALPPAPGDPLALGVAVYPDEKLVYWTDPAATLLEATNAAGPWVVLSNAVCPVRIPGALTAEYFRLKQ